MFKRGATTDPIDTLRDLKSRDDARPGVPGEHLVTLGAGLALWMLTRRSPSFLLRNLGLVAGTALAGRAASGRGGIARLLRVLPIGRGYRRF